MAASPVRTGARARRRHAAPSRAPQGDEQLRSAIAQMLRRSRGIAARPEHVAVTGGSMQAIALLAQLLVAPGEAAAAETPAFTGVRRAIAAAGGRCIDAAVDAQGIVPADWDAKALFVTPARQFPTGAVLSLERRQAPLRWAAEREAVIVEDDYDSEFRHRGKSLEPLKVLDRGERVVYVGGFTTTAPPHVRIGYAVLPPRLAGPFARALALYEPRPVNLLEQRALAAFMQSGEYERHLRRMKRIYSRKFALLAAAGDKPAVALVRLGAERCGAACVRLVAGDSGIVCRLPCPVRDAGGPLLGGGIPGFVRRRQALRGLSELPHLSEEELQLGIDRMRQATEEISDKM
ncbi:PLP-dependent aminotransferase family protein [Paenibacillus sp. P26]|nr:PLP-dependent aminotransferase family protein [Paenibacillus sp. P26]